MTDRRKSAELVDLMGADKVKMREKGDWGRLLVDGVTVAGVGPSKREDEPFVRVRRKMVAFADYAGHILCDDCNHHALRPHENEVKPLLIGLMNGARPTFNEDEQSLLAGWGAKVACNLLAIERKRRGVPKRHRTHLLKHAVPHGDCFVAYGRYSGGGVRIFAGRARLTPQRGFRAIRSCSRTTRLRRSAKWFSAYTGS